MLGFVISFPKESVEFEESSTASEPSDDYYKGDIGLFGNDPILQILFGEIDSLDN